MQEQSGLDFELYPPQESELVAGLHLLMQELILLRNFLSVRVADNPNISEWEAGHVDYVRNKYFTIKGAIDILNCFQATAVHMRSVEQSIIIISDKFSEIW